MSQGIPAGHEPADVGADGGNEPEQRDQQVGAPAGKRVTDDGVACADRGDEHPVEEVAVPLHLIQGAAKPQPNERYRDCNYFQQTLRDHVLKLAPPARTQASRRREDARG